MASTDARTPNDSRSVHVAVLGLRQALEKANASRTLQEGLYRAYQAHLCFLDPVDGMPQALGDAIHDLVIELRRAFGFDETTGAKIATSRLRQRQAALLLARLEAIASSAENLAEGAETGAPH